MALILIMNEDGTLGHKTGSQITGGTFIIESAASTKGKANAKGVYAETFEYSFSGGSHPSVNPNSVRTLVDQEIPATALKVKAEGELVMREGDFALMNAVGDNPSPPPTTLPVTGNVEIATAGQTKVKAQ